MDKPGGTKSWEVLYRNSLLVVVIVPFGFGIPATAPKISFTIDVKLVGSFLMMRMSKIQR